MNIVEAWSADLQQRLAGEPLHVADLRIGVFYTAAVLSTGHAGVAFTPRDLSDTVCCPRTAAEAPPAGRMAGRDAWELADYARSRVALRRPVGVAVLNALSALAMERFGIPGGQERRGLDALVAAGIQPDDRVAMVGAFVPFIKALKGKVEQLWIVDRHRDALKADEQDFWRAPEEAAATLGQASVAIITGSALVEGGLDELLAATRQARRVVMAGPTASPWPPTFFERGVHVLGGIRITDGPKILQITSEGGSGYFYESAAEKTCILRDDVVPAAADALATARAGA